MNRRFAVARIRAGAAADRMDSLAHAAHSAASIDGARRVRSGEAIPGMPASKLAAALRTEPSGRSDPLTDFSKVPVGAAIARSAIAFDASLDRYTPALTENGSTRLGRAALWMSPGGLRSVLRHEAVHALHQRIAPKDESYHARTQAEDLAARAEHGAFPDRADLSVPVPSRLAYPPQHYAPWSSVWFGGNYLIGEIEEAGIKVRIELDYTGLKLNGSSEYHCGVHDPAPIPDIVAKMKKVARAAARANDKLPAGVAQRVALVFVHGVSGENGYRTVDGKGIIVLERKDFDANAYEATLAHEGSHAIFEYHSVRGDKDQAKRAPDALALGVAAIYNVLQGTKPVPMPSAKFDKKSPPSMTDDGTVSTKPAGVVMVTDVLWAGAGGHPWDSVDEFFASAYGAYITDKALLKAIVAHYGRADPKIPVQAAELFKLFDTIGNPKLYGGLAKPTDAKVVKSAGEALLKAGAPPVLDSNNPSLGYLVDPTTMPGPDTIVCPPAGTSKTSPQDVMDFADPTHETDGGKTDRPASKAKPGEK